MTPVTGGNRFKKLNRYTCACIRNEKGKEIDQLFNLFDLLIRFTLQDVFYVDDIRNIPWSVGRRRRGVGE